MAFAAEVKAAAGDRGGGADPFAQLVARRARKGRLGGKGVTVARDTGGVDLAVDHRGGGVEARVREPLEPHAPAGARVVAAGETRVVDEVDVLAARHGAGNVGEVLAIFPD